MARTRADHARREDAAGTFLLPLEPRQLLAFLAAPIADSFDLPTRLFELQAPAGVTVAGFGSASVGVGDVDGDGRADFAVAAPGREGDSPVNGAVFVFSGADRTLITTIQGAVPNFGFSLLNVGDVSGDGDDDLAIGSPNEAIVRVYSPASGNIERTFTGDAGSAFGYALALQIASGASEGVLLVGAPLRNGNGSVHAFDLQSSAQRFTTNGTVPGARFGHALAVIGEVWDTAEDAYGTDGFPEILVGAPGASDVDAGAVAILEGELGVQLNTASGTAGFGSALLYLQTSSSSQILVGAPSAAADTGGRVHFAQIVSWDVRPSLTVYDYSALRGEEPTFGSTLVGLGDLDRRDGLEFGVGSPVRDGSTPAFHVGVVTQGGTLVLQAGPSASGLIGIGAIGDTDGDGLNELLLGAATGPAVAYSEIAYFALQRPTVTSRNGEYLIFAGPDAGSYDGSRPVTSARRYVIHDGVITALENLPGVGTDFEVLAVNDNGVIAGFVIQPPEFPWAPPTRIEAAIVRDGVRTALDDLIASIQGPTDINTLQFAFKRIGPGGDVLIEEARPYPGTPRAWLLTPAGELIFLWNGYVEDHAADGNVLGTERADITVDGETRLWTRSGGKVALPRFFNAGRINDDKEIIGTDQNGDLAVFRDGRVTRLARAADIIPGVDSAGWTVFGIDNQGRGVARLEWYDFVAGASHSGVFTYFIDEDNQLTRLDSLIALGTPPAGLWEDSREGTRFYGAPPITVLNNGDLIVAGSYLLQIDAAQGLVADDRGVRATSAGVSGMRAVAVNPDGIPISFRLVDNREWQGRSLSGLAGTLSADGDLAVFVDPKDGQTYAVTLGRVSGGEDAGNGTVTLYREQSDGTFGEPRTLNDTSFSASAIRTRLTVFVSTDNRVHIAGLNDNGQLIMFWQTGGLVEGSTTQWQWFFENVELAHLAPQGQTTPQWVDELSVYVAPWNGLNIAGLTATGDAEVVWWAPGRQYWSRDNLSDNTGLTTLVGGLTSYVTPWGGLNVAGIDTNGDLQVVWWVPGFGTQWQSNNMTVQFDGQKLDPATVSSYVTPWGGLNIAGIDTESGDAIVYWWAPGLTDWVPEPLTFNRDPQDPLPTGRLVAQNNGDQLNLFGRADSGEVIRLYWNPGDGGVWGLQNLTRISV